MNIIKKKKNEVDGLFPIRLVQYSNGTVTVENVKKEKFEIKTKNGENITYEEYDKIIDKHLGFYQLVKRYKLEPVDTGRTKE